MADEPHRRKAGAAAKKQPKDFDLFEEDILDDGGGDIANAAKRRRHGDCSFVHSLLLLSFLHKLLIEGLHERTEYIDIFLFSAHHSIVFCFRCSVYWWKGSVRF